MTSYKYNIVLLLIMLVSVYLSLCSILAIPILEESNSLFSKENSLSLQEQLNTDKKNYSTNIESLQIDTITLNYFEQVNKKLNYIGRSANILYYWNDRIKQTKQRFDEVAEGYMIQFDTTRSIGATTRTTLSKRIQKAYLDFLSKSYQSLYGNLFSIRKQVAMLYASISPDTNIHAEDAQTPRKSQADSVSESLRKEYSTFYRSLYSSESITSDTIDSRHYTKDFRFFILANWPIDNDSQFMAIFLGVIGLSFFSSTLAALNREKISLNLYKSGSSSEFFNDLGFALLKGFSASVVAYLSLKGGISLITNGSATNTPLNPYFVLFVCFVAAFYSDDIWELAKQKVFTPKKDDSKTNTTENPK
jgi:hypothetical protein